MARASAAATASPSAPITGRIAEPRAGFALTLADGWRRNNDPGELFYMTGGVLQAEDGLGSRISVALYPLSLFDADPAQAADPVGAMAEVLMGSMPGGRPFSMPALDPTNPTANPTDLPGSTTRSAVILPAGPAVRLDGVVEGGQNTTVWLLGGGFSGGGYPCEVEGTIHVVTASFADPAALSVVEKMARSLDLLPQGAVLEAIGCVAPPVIVTWSFAQHLDADPGQVDLVSWEGGFVAVGTRSGPVVWVSDSGKTWEEVEFPPAPAATFVDAQVALGGLVVVQSSESGPAIVWGSRAGWSWSELSRLTAAGTCSEPWSFGNPSIADVYTSGSSLVLSGYICETANTNPVDRIWRTEDGVAWTVVAVVAPDALVEGIAPSITEAAPGMWDVARAGPWYIAADQDLGRQQGATTLLWISRDGATWSALPSPAEAGPRPHVAGRDGLVVLATAGAEGGTDIWIGEISPVNSP